MANNGTDIGKAYVQIIPSAEGISGKVKEVLDPVGNEAGESFGKKLFSAFKTIATTVAIGKIVGDALNQGGQLQQSIGGVETLFKESADVVKNNALQAFQTVGMSANEYMQNVTGFSASLLQSLGNDAEKAASVADMAMTDMADNANKMGTSLDSITTAYQGFAKQNYTMLDNLKLGYGGTKTEMERLLKDAQKITGVKYDLNNLSDVYEAIHVIQGELGITGTTAEEASKTLEGSANAMKAAWTDFLGILTSSGDFGDIGTALKNVTSTFSTWAFGNLLPMLGKIIGNVPTVIMGLFEAIPQFLPQITETGTQMFNALIEGIETNVPQLVSKGAEFVRTIVEGIGTALPGMIESAFQLISTLGNALIEYIPLLAEYLPTVVTGILTYITENAPRMIEGAVQLITQLGTGLINTLPSLATSVSQIVSSVVTWFMTQDWAQLGKDAVTLIANGLIALASAAVTAISTVCTDLWDTFTTTDWKALGEDLLTKIGEGIAATVSAAVEAISSVCTDVWDAVTTTDWGTLGKNIVDGIVSGIVNFGSGIWTALKNAIGGAWSGALNFLDINSPSKLMRDTVGSPISEGIAAGIWKSADLVDNAMSDVTGLVANTDIDATIKAPNAASIAPAPTGSTYNITMNAYANDNIDTDAFVNQTVEKIVQMIREEDAVWA